MSSSTEDTEGLINTGTASRSGEWQRLSTETLNKNPWSEFRHDTFRLPSGSAGNYYYIHTPGSVSIIPVTADGSLVLHRQFRYLFQRESLEFPGGGIKPGQTPRQAAEAELAEEVGMRAESLTLIGKVAPANGLMDETEYIFLASDLTPVTATPDETEVFTVVTYTVTQIDAAIASGEMWDGFTIAPWAVAKPHVQTLLKAKIKES